MKSKMLLECNVLISRKKKAGTRKNKISKELTVSLFILRKVYKAIRRMGRVRK